ncbi:MAG: hypothetical protein ACOX3G_05300 [Armatimonadota bacterium]
MNSEWFDYIEDDAADSQESSFYCPYTNTDKCALLLKGLQPQELCSVLECPQLKLIKHDHRSRKKHRAA